MTNDTRRGHQSSQLSRKAFLAAAGGFALAGAMIGRAESRGAQQHGNGIALGLAGYSMRDFTVDETLFWLQRWGLRSWAVKAAHLPLESGPDEIEAFARKAEAAGIKVYAAGVIYMKTESDVANAFAYGQRLGVSQLVAAPVEELLPAVERTARATDIRVAIHNHGPDMDLFPTPESIHERLQGMDPRIGICMDIGHTQRCGVDPAESFERCLDRIFDLHIKDVDKAAKDGKTVALGRGVIDLRRLVTAIRKSGFSGVCAIEYEAPKGETLAGLAESVGFWRGMLSSDT